MELEKTISDPNFQVRFLEYSPTPDLTTAARKTVLIIPPTGGTNFIDRSYAKALCKAGLRAVILNHWSEDDEFNYELEIHTRFYSRAQRAIDLLVKEFSGPASTEVTTASKTEIGILGTSVGALHASIAFARRPEITSAFLIVGGGDIADIIVHSNQGVMEDAKRERFQRYGFKSNEEYKSALDKILPYEPLKIEFDRSRKRLGMVISASDLTVPGKNQLQMRDQWKPDVIYESRWQHMGAIVSTWLFDTRNVVEFF